jgi:hypothetical protein
MVVEIEKMMMGINPGLSININFWIFLNNG